MGRDTAGRPGLSLAFPGLSRPVALYNAPEVLSALCTGLAGWVPQVAAPAAPARAASVIAGDRRGHAVRSAWLDEPMTGLSATAAFCGAVADLSECWIADRPGHLALHAGGVIAGDGLIAIAGEARAGKSTLMARLTMEPWARVLCDDVLPIDPNGRGMALGIPPRLRLPLPPGTSTAFADHVATRHGPQDRQYAYLDPGCVAPHGTRAPLRKLVILTRVPGAPARLHALPPAEAVAHLHARNMGQPAPGEDTAARLSALVAGMTCLRLVCSDLEETVTLLRDLAEGTAPVHPPATFGTLAAPPADPAQRWTRTEGVGLRRQEGMALLWRPAGNARFALNPTGVAVWTLLEEPLTGEEIAETLALAFEGVGPAAIAADVAALLGEMAAADLIRPA